MAFSLAILYFSFHLIVTFALEESILLHV